MIAQLTSTVRLHMENGTLVHEETVTGKRVHITKDGEFFNVMVNPYQWMPNSRNGKRKPQNHQARIFVRVSSVAIVFPDEQGDEWINQS